MTNFTNVWAEHMHIFYNMYSDCCVFNKIFTKKKRKKKKEK